MCGIIAYKNTQVTPVDMKILKKVMIESRIRGMHASGVAWFDGKKIQSYVKPIPIDRLLDEFSLNQIIYNGRVAMIAHARYSTSDLKYNQPIVGKMAIAHNGVITQSDPSNWEATYGYKCETKNDSELLLRCLENGDNPYKVFSDSSIAYTALDSSGTIAYGRNHLRPLWRGKTPGGGMILASTYHILKMAGVEEISKVTPADGNELQRRDWNQWTTHKI